METFIKHFVREGAGVWRCIAPATLQLPGGRVQVAPGTVVTRGKKFMNVEVAKLLDEHYDRHQGR